MKSFYNNFEALHGEKAMQAHGEATRFLDDFFDRWIAMGYTTRQIQSLLVDELIITSSEKRLAKAMKMHTAESTKNRVEDYKEALKENEFTHLENKETGEITFVKGEKE